MTPPRRTSADAPRVGSLPSKLSRVPSPDSWRIGKTTSERGYGWRWQRARAAFLARPENVLCVMCAAEGRTTIAVIVDHIVPHRGDPALFWDASNWQSLCATHHNSQKQSQEKGGQIRGCDLSGVPNDPDHHWK